MDSHAQLINYLKRSVEVTDEEAALFSSYFEEVKVKKGQYIIQPGFVARHRNYVIAGAFRSFVNDNKGQDHTTSFAIADWWISDVNSYIYQQPATMFVVALENSIILQISYEKEKELKGLNHKYETFFRAMAERGMAFLQKRIMSGLTHTAEERYNYFMEKYPAIAARVPQYALASYLDMTTQFLSRIRKKQSGK